MAELGGSSILTALIGGFASLALMTLRGRVKKTLWNVGFVLNEMKSGRAGYLVNEELDVRSAESIGLPHGAVSAVAALAFVALSVHFTS